MDWLAATIGLPALSIEVEMLLRPADRSARSARSRCWESLHRECRSAMYRGLRSSKAVKRVLPHRATVGAMPDGSPLVRHLRGLRETPLSTQLGRRSTRETEIASGYYAEGEYERMSIHAGMAIETGIKAALARVNPLLLSPVERDWDRFAPILLSGAPLEPRVWPKPSGRESHLQVVTVGAARAAKRLHALNCGLAPGFEEWVDDVFTARNDLAHAGLSHPEDHKSHHHVAASFFRAILELGRLADPGGTQPGYSVFREHAGLAESAVTNTEDEELVAFSQKVAAARKRYHEMQAAHRLAIRQNAEERVLGLLDAEAIGVECPVCGSLALGTGDLYDDGEPEFDENGEPYLWAPDMRLRLTDVVCFVCSFDLTLLDIHRSEIERYPRHPTATRSDLPDPTDDEPYDRSLFSSVEEV